MKGSKEQYIELCEEWVNLNPITGFQVYAASDYDGNFNDGWKPVRAKKRGSRIIKRKVKKKTLLYGLKSMTTTDGSFQLGETE